MYRLFIGIDVSKSWVDAAMWWEGKAQSLGRFSNDHTGFTEWLEAVRQRSTAPCSKWFVCFENTGTYSKVLFHWLVGQNIPCLEENPIRIRRSKGLTRGKDDMIDARSICTYAFRHRDELKAAQLPDKSIVQIKKLLSRRALIVRQRASLSTSLKEQKHELDPSLYQLLESQNQEMIALYTKQIRELEKHIDQIIQSDEQMLNNYTLIRSVKGIGPIIAWHLIATSNNFKDFDNHRQFACYCGIAPFPNRSGKSYQGRDHVHHFANKYIKALLTNGANVAIQTDPELKRYYLHKRQLGKAYGTVINAVKNKLIARAFAVVNRQSPFVPLMKYAS